VGVSWPNGSALDSRWSGPVPVRSGFIVLCSSVNGYFSLRVPLSSRVNKWAPAHLMLGEDNSAMD